jgi:hypothetical protein
MLTRVKKNRSFFNQQQFKLNVFKNKFDSSAKKGRISQLSFIRCHVSKIENMILMIF